MHESVGGKVISIKELDDYEGWELVFPNEISDNEGQWTRWMKERITKTQEGSGND